MSRGKKISLGSVVIYIVLGFWALTTIYPIFWVIINSFKAKGEILSNSFALPTGAMFTLANYRTAFERLSIFSAYRNSMIISTSVAAIVIVLAGMASFGLVRYEFKLRKPLNSLVVAGMMFPVFSTIIPVYRMLSSAHMVNTESLALSLTSVILPQVAGNMSFAIVVLTGYVRSLPIELEESAYVDGANDFVVLIRIVLPLSKAMLATIALFYAVSRWNGFMDAILYINDESMYTIQLRLRQMIQASQVSSMMEEIPEMKADLIAETIKAACMAFSMIPVMIVYPWLQKYFVKGVMIGSVKG